MASGIAEHNEARRREMVYLRKAFLAQEKQKAYNEQMGAFAAAEQTATSRFQNGVGTSYDDQVLQKQSTYVTTYNRDLPGRMLPKKENEAYSAKIPNRYTSIDYVSQW